LFTATQDIAVDGLAVELISKKDLGFANIAQVVGAKAGALLVSTLLIPLYPWIGWEGVLFAISGLLTSWAVSLLFWDEPPAPPQVAEQRGSMEALLTTMIDSLRQPGTVWMLLFVASYKVGEELIDPMLRPFLIDAGYRKEQLSLWVGS